MITKFKNARQAKRTADQMYSLYSWRPSGPGR
jgi:hypothetical protein